MPEAILGRPRASARKALYKFADPQSVGRPAGVDRANAMLELTLQCGKLKITMSVPVIALASLLMPLYY